MFIRFDTMHERDGHTQTPHDDIGRACTASRGKNCSPVCAYRQYNGKMILTHITGVAVEGTLETHAPQYVCITVTDWCSELHHKF